MRANAILVTHQDGHRWVTDVSGVRIEIHQRHSGDVSEILHKAGAEVDTYKAGQVQIQVGIDPEVGDPKPGKDYTAGDRATVDGSTQDIEAMACQVDDATGRVIAVPEFGTVLDEPSERIARTLRGIGGLNGGTSRLTRMPTRTPPPGVAP